MVSTIFQQQCSTGFVAETIGADSSVRLTRTPIVEHIVRPQISGRHHSKCTSPEPTIDVQRLEPGGVTTFDLLVAKTTSIVNIFNIGSFHESFDKVLFSLGFEADHVHAHFAAIVSSGEPIPTSVSQIGFVTGP